jgi:hypothetical protein
MTKEKLMKRRVTPPFMPIDRGWKEFRHFAVSMLFHETVTQIATLISFSL